MHKEYNRKGSDVSMEQNLELVQSKTNFSFHLNGSNSVDVELLSKTIHDVVRLTDLAAKEENPEAYLKMDVTAFNDGCFEISFSAICEFAKNLFTNPGKLVGFAASVVSIVNGFFDIKKHLNGKAPKSVSKPDKAGNITVENSASKKISVKKSSGAIINNYQIDHLTVNISGYAADNNPKGGFSITTENGSSTYDADDIKAISKPLPIEERKTCQVSRIDTYLPIKKADFLGRSSWDFKYQNHNITAKVMDDDLIDIAHSGAPLRAGDYIHAKLEIRVDLNEFGLAIEGSEQYTILEAIGGIHHKEEAEQLKLF